MSSAGATKNKCSDEGRLKQLRDFLAEVALRRGFSPTTDPEGWYAVTKQDLINTEVLLSPSGICYLNRVIV